MRFAADAPKNVMEALLVHVHAVGRGEGYRRFSLGMAPLSGFERSPVAPLWQRVGAFLYEHGEAFYGFQGLRAFKEKFDAGRGNRATSPTPAASRCRASSPTSRR